MKVKLPRDLKLKLVDRAERIATSAANAGRGEVTQLRNLVQITQEESDVEVLRNFLEYQAGRRATQKFWKDIHRPVIEALEGIAQECKPLGADVQRLAIQSFFGYMVRHYVYRTKVGARPARAAGAR